MVAEVVEVKAVLVVFEEHIFGVGDGPSSIISPLLQGFNHEAVYLLVLLDAIEKLDEVLLKAFGINTAFATFKAVEFEAIDLTSVNENIGRLFDKR